jgi:guanylate kinase
MISQGEFWEWAKVHGQYYGTHKNQTLKKLNTHPVIFNVDVQGAKQIMHNTVGHPLVSIFLLPESTKQIKERIIRRGHSDPDDLARRLESAKRELKEQNIYQHQIVNSEGRVEETIAQVEKILAPYLI